ARGEAVLGELSSWNSGAEIYSGIKQRQVLYILHILQFLTGCVCLLAVTECAPCLHQASGARIGALDSAVQNLFAVTPGVTPGRFCRENCFEECVLSD